MLGIDANHCPETLGQIFILNAPALFCNIWRLASYIVDKKTKTKINFLTPDQYPEMLKSISPSQLPVEYGGSCSSCRSGHSCVPHLGEPYMESKMSIDGQVVKDPLPGGEEIAPVEKINVEKTKVFIEEEPALCSRIVLENKEHAVKSNGRLLEKREFREEDKIESRIGKPGKLKHAPAGVLIGNSWEMRKKMMKSEKKL